MHLITILGGTGIFGSRIASDLASTGAVVRVVARDPVAGAALADRIGCEFRRADVRRTSEIRHAIDGSSIVLHAAGPFQQRDYRVAQTCIDMRCHYLDLADAREFVCGIAKLELQARRGNVLVMSGASSVPAITHALISELQPHFACMDEIQIALSPGNQNPRGEATIAAILSYLGQPIRLQENDRWIVRPGWSDVRWLAFAPPVGRRRVHLCDVPDLELFPSLFNARTVRFHAGVELNVINYALSAIANVRSAISFHNVHKLAPLFLRATMLLYRFGSGNGSLSVWVRGIDHFGESIQKRIAIITDDDGPATPCSPSIVLTKRILDQGPPRIGATPCIGFVTVAELELHLRRFGVWIARGDQHGWHAARS